MGLSMVGFMMVNWVVGISLVVVAGVKVIIITAPSPQSSSSSTLPLGLAHCYYHPHSHPYYNPSLRTLTICVIATIIGQTINSSYSLPLHITVNRTG